MNARTQDRTLAQKLIARASGRDHVAVGEIVTCDVDLAMFHDSSGPRRLKPMLEELGAQIWDRSRIVLVMDHYVPERDDDSRRIVRIARDWARDQQLPHVYDSQGICHVVVPQHGHIRPGMLCVGGDSHSPTGGAFGAYMFGVGSTEMLGVLVTGQIWLRVPETLQMWWDGKLSAGVTAKDMMLHMIGRFDASALEPHIAAPHSPANSHGVSRYADTPVDVAYIGACTGAKLDDLRAAAQVLRGHKVAAGIRLIVAPASIQDQEQAREEGVLQVLMDAGAELFPTACGACSGYGDPMGDDVTVISTTARNFKGRMGSPTAQVYLGSPYTVAAAALRGRVTDPREVLA